MDAFLSQFKTWVKLAVSFALILASLQIVGSFGMYSSAQLGTLLHEMYSTQLTAIAELSEVKLAALMHNRTIYELAAEQDSLVIDDILKDMKAHETKMRQHLAAYEKTGLGNEEKLAYEKFNAAWKAYIDKIDSVAAPARAGSTASAMMIAGGMVQNLFKLADNELKAMSDIVAEEGRQADASGSAIAQRIQTVSLALMAASIVLGIINAIVVTRNITRPLSRAVSELRNIAAGDMTSLIVVKGRDESADMLRSLADVQQGLSSMVTQLKLTAENLNQSVHDVTEDSHQLSRRAAESSDAISSAAAAIEQLTVSIDVVGNNADEASGKATEAGGAARQGRDLGEEASGDVIKAAAKVGETADMIQNLSGQVQQIGTIANVIKDIADQTNLLALNAAIEAARAGEQGRGFAVVADEVRKLAERTTTSAQEITSMIGAIQSGTGSVVTSMDVSRSTMDVVRDKVTKTTEAIRRIEDNTASAVSSTGEISVALREQKAASSGIAQSVENIAQLSGENANTAHHLSESMTKVRQVSSELGAVIARFKVRG